MHRGCGFEDQRGVGLQADMDRFGEDGSLDDNVESFLSHEEADPRESLFGSSNRSPAGHSMDVSKGESVVLDPDTLDLGVVPSLFCVGGELVWQEVGYGAQTFTGFDRRSL